MAAPFVDSDAEKPLHLAVKHHRSADYLRALILHGGADVNEADAAGKTALGKLLALPAPPGDVLLDPMRNRMRCVRLLLHEGATVAEDEKDAVHAMTIMWSVGEDCARDDWLRVAGMQIAAMLWRPVAYAPLVPWTLSQPKPFFAEQRAPFMLSEASAPWFSQNVGN